MRPQPIPPPHPMPPGPFEDSLRHILRARYRIDAALPPEIEDLLADWPPLRAGTA